ncbi:MAG: DMT family transporter [Dehalobacterium sp.]
MNLKTKGIFLGVVSAISWGTYGSFLTLLGNLGINYMTLVALAPTITWLFFFIKILISNRSAFNLTPKLYIILALSGLINIDGMNFCYVKALATVPVGIVSICAFCNVLFLMVFTKIMFGYKFTSHKLIASLAAILGVTLVLQVFNAGGVLNVAGIGWAIAIPIVLAVGYTIQKYCLVDGVEPDAVMFFLNFFGALGVYIFQVSPAVMIKDVAHVISINGSIALLAVLGFALFPQIISFFAFINAYKYIEPTYVSVCYGLDPVTAGILGFILFGQKLGISQIIGIIIVILAILFIQYKEGKEDLAVAETVTG